MNVIGEVADQSLTPDDWLIVEQRYRLGADTVESIAATFGLTPRSLRSQAEKRGWIRDAREVKRAVVDQAMATGLAPAPQTLFREDDGAGPSYANAIATAAVEDIKDMNMSLSIARRLQERVMGLLDSGQDFTVKELDGLAQVNHKTMLTIRTVRGLGERDAEDVDLTKAMARARARLVAYDSR